VIRGTVTGNREPVVCLQVRGPGEFEKFRCLRCRAGSFTSFVLPHFRPLSVRGRFVLTFS